MRHPMLPALQSVSQPAVVTIASVRRSRRLRTAAHMPSGRGWARRGRCRRSGRTRSAPRSIARVRASRARWRRQSRRSSMRRRMIESAGICATPMSNRRSRSSSTKAWASIAARTCAAWTAAPSWLTDAARRARSAAASGSPGWSIAQPSMKIWAPICSATTWPLRAIDPLAGAGMPRLQSQVGGVLGGVPESAPPQDRPALDQVVEPRLADLARRERRIMAVIRHAPGRT